MAWKQTEPGQKRTEGSVRTLTCRPLLLRRWDTQKHIRTQTWAPQQPEEDKSTYWKRQCRFSLHCSSQAETIQERFTGYSRVYFLRAPRHVKRTFTVGYYFNDAAPFAVPNIYTDHNLPSCSSFRLLFAKMTKHQHSIKGPHILYSYSSWTAVGSFPWLIISRKQHI